ncbi:MAG: hypothetical protein BM557_11670, partial [Flavobacterium sp. MedPE-SWcel]
MKKIDYKHTAFHSIIAFYFIWLIVFIGLISTSIINFLKKENSILNNLFIKLILLNLIIGGMLIIVYRLFKNKSSL